MRFLGPILLLFGHTLILIVIYLFLMIILPIISYGSNTLYWSHLLWGIFLAINILFNYVACVYTPPGSPPYCADPGRILGQQCITPTEALDPLYNIRYNFTEGILSVGVMKKIVMFVLTLTASGGISVGLLLFWHIYLVITNQTTIEFYINMDERQMAKEEGYKYTNPFFESTQRNLSRVFGVCPWYLALLPSIRPPDEPLYPLVLCTDMTTMNASDNSKVSNINRNVMSRSESYGVDHRRSLVKGTVSHSQNV
eukprot:gene1523-2930_t